MNGHEMLKKLVEVLLEDGADGFYVTGSTGECFLLSEEERIKITATVGKKLRKLLQYSQDSKMMVSPRPTR